MVARRALQSLREFFLLEQTEQRTAAVAEPLRATVRGYYFAARRRVESAESLRGPRATPATLTLYREAGLLSALAYLAAEDGAVEAKALTREDAFTKLGEALHTKGVQVPPQFERAKRTLLSSDPLWIDRLPAAEAERKARDAEVATRWLLELVDPRTPRDVKVVRLARILVAASAIVAVLIVGAVRIFGPRNIALHKRVIASSVAYDSHPDAVVDGEKNGRFGFHSDTSDAPWLLIDLGSKHVIDKIRIYGRGDCCYDQSTPLAVELSDEGGAFRPIATRSDDFSEYTPWVVKPGSVTARFVRLRTEKKAAVLVLGEVEIFGRPSAAIKQ